MDATAAVQLNEEMHIGVQPTEKVVDPNEVVLPNKEVDFTNALQSNIYTNDNTTPKICFSHLPATEEVRGHQAPSWALVAVRSLAVEAPAPILYRYINNVLAQFKKYGPFIGLNLILLDSESPIHLFTNRELLQNIHTAPNCACITVNTSTGSVTIYQRGDLLGFGPVWYCPKGILSNVLSLGLIPSPQSDNEHQLQ